MRPCWAPNTFLVGKLDDCLLILMNLPSSQVKGPFLALAIQSGEMWRELMDWGRTFMLDEQGQLASPEDFNIPICVSTAGEVNEVFKESRGTWLAEAQA